VEVFTVQISNPTFGGIFSKNNDDKNKKTKHAGHTHHQHKAHGAHAKKHHPSFGAVTASGHGDSFSRTAKP